MQACTLLNTFAGSVLVFTLGFAGCTSSTLSSAETPNPSEAAPSAPEGSEPSASGSADSADSADKWEGESEATASEAAAPSGEGQESRTTAIIQKQIVDNRKPFRDCYDKARKELPELRGTMTIHFVLDTEGKVKKAELNLDRSEIKTANVSDCAIGVLKSMKFPPSSRGMETTVNYPFDFKP
jgi:hypothetical protein